MIQNDHNMCEVMVEKAAIFTPWPDEDPKKSWPSQQNMSQLGFPSCPIFAKIRNGPKHQPDMLVVGLTRPHFGRKEMETPSWHQDHQGTFSLLA